MTLAFSALIIFLLGPIADHQRFASQGIATLLLVGNLGAYKFSGDYFWPNPNPLVHTWSLSVEEQIYIFLPLILMLILHNRRSLEKVTVVLLGVISAVSFVSFLFPTILEPLYSPIGIEFASQFSFYSPIDRIWQFTLGGLAFLSRDLYQNYARNIPKGIHFITVIAVVITLFGPLQMNLKVSSIVASLFALMVILFKSLDVLPDFLSTKLEWVGDRSYSIYLVHMPLLHVAEFSPAVQIGNTENRIFQLIVAVFLSILFGAVTYSTVENRFRNGYKNQPLNFKAATFTFILTFIAPLSLFVAMAIGLNSQYWGLDRNIQQPEFLAYAESLDPNCKRDSENGPPCFYLNKGATKTVLLIGDSHAGHISQAVIDAAKNSNWNSIVWTHHGCLIQFEQSINGNLSTRCIEANLRMKSWVEGNKLDAIIVSQYIRFDSSEGDLINALSTLRSLVPMVLLVENNPIFPDEKDFMVKRPLIMSPYIPPKEFTRSKMEIIDKPASDRLASWARENAILTMNFESLFCDIEYCMRFNNNSWLYRDNNHFSVSGADLTIPKFSSFLNGL